MLTLTDSVVIDADLSPPSSRHRDKETEFVTLCKSLHVTDQVCDHAWTLWKTIQDSMEELEVRIYRNVSLKWRPEILLLLYNNYHYSDDKSMYMDHRSHICRVICVFIFLINCRKLL